MTSVLAKEAEIDPRTKFVNIQTRTYYESNVDAYIPVPFTVTNNVLDINNWSGSVNNFIDNGIRRDFYCDVRVKPMGGLSKVTSFGTNMLNYLSNAIQRWENRHGGTNSITNIQMNVEPLMTRIQTSADTYENDQPLRRYRPINFHPSLPSGTDYVFFGDSNNDYLSSWVFQSPLTVSYDYSDEFVNETRYMTLKTVFNAW